MSGSPSPAVMVADIGGTTIRVALDRDGDLSHLVRVESASVEPDPAPWLRSWIAALPQPPLAACISVAGPVRDPGFVELTNVRLRLRADALGVPALLVNDLHAAAMGLPLVAPEQRVHLGGLLPADGPVGVLGVGTGLGQAIALGDRVLPGEGGHGAYAPQDEGEVELLRFLQGRRGYVDWEHVCSGTAFGELLEFARGRFPASPALPSDVPAGAWVLGRAETDPACELALRLMVSALGREAGNVGLRHLTTGGVWLIGGVAARLRPWLHAEGFRRAFEERGRFSPLAASLPRMLVLDEEVGLRGAGRLARRLLQSPRPISS